MADGTSGPSPPTQSLFGVLPEVVKGLRKRPPLLFGIGAGIVLVAVLAATTSVWLVLIVACVLVLALGAWVVNEAATRRRSEAGIKNILIAKRSKIRRSDVGKVDNATGGVQQRVDAEGADISDSSVGTVGLGPSERRRRN
jgi:hypothetical protein